jgi:metal-responsive CopG/Arc/MetJ family transcriptional regulator
MYEDDMMRLNLSISDDLAAKLDELSQDGETSKSEILRKALTLFAMAKDATRHGKRLGLVGEGGQVTTEIVGL